MICTLVVVLPRRWHSARHGWRTAWRRIGDGWLARPPPCGCFICGDTERLSSFIHTGKHIGARYQSSNAYAFTMRCAIHVKLREPSLKHTIPYHQVSKTIHNIWCKLFHPVGRWNTRLIRSRTILSYDGCYNKYPKLEASSKSRLLPGILPQDPYKIYLWAIIF